MGSSGAMAEVNPLRYRGYYFDQETGLYYLNDRYYDPFVCRFVNADGYICTGQDILGANMFVYCGNNPVLRADTEGTAWWIPVTAVVGGVVGVLAKVASNALNGTKLSEGVIGAAVGGAVFGAVIASTGEILYASIAGAAAESLTNEIVSYTPLGNWNGSGQKELTVGNVVDSIVTIGSDTVINGSINVLTGKMANAIIPTSKYWFTPVKLYSSLFGRYAIKSELQTVIQGLGQIIVSGLRKLLEKLK